MVRNGEWWECGEGSRAPEDSTQTADADSSRAEGTVTLVFSVFYIVHVFACPLYVQMFETEIISKLLEMYS